jgi:N-glycosylase/DNA lyase
MELDVEEIYNKVMKQLPFNLTNVMQKRNGVRIIKQNVFECIISYISSSNNNIERIKKMLNSFRKNFGHKLYEDNIYGKLYSFPSLEDLNNSSFTETKLRYIGFGYRANFIIKSVEIIRTKDNNWIDNILKMEDPSEELQTLQGVGKKVADCICLCSLKKHNIVPLDIHMIKFYNETITKLNKSYQKIEKMNDNNYKYVSKKFYEVFGEYAGWIHSIFYLNRIQNRSISQGNTENKGNELLKGKRKSKEISIKPKDRKKKKFN